jgi:hypothetical protein
MNASIRNPMWRFASYAVLRRRLMLVMILGFSACGQRHSGEDGEGKGSRAASIRVAQEFLRNSASGDSVRLTRLALDTVVNTVLLNHRLGSAEHFRAAAETFRAGKVSVYPDGSDVQFRYRLAGKEYDAFVALQSQQNQLVVSDYGVPAIID